jgi:nucleoid DNA-binding protein
MHCRQSLNYPRYFVAPYTVKALEWAVAEVKSAKAQGEEVNLSEFVAAKFMTKTRKPRKRKEPRENRPIMPGIKE